MISQLVTVHSADGVPFVVQTSAHTASQITLAALAEAAFARTRTAAQLDQHGDFIRQSVGIDALWIDPVPYQPVHRRLTRADLRVINGGKS